MSCKLQKTAEELLAISLKQLSFDSIMRDFKIQHSKLKEMYVHEKSQRRLYSQWARHLVLRQGKIGGPSANEDQIVANHTISSPGVEVSFIMFFNLKIREKMIVEAPLKG